MGTLGGSIGFATALNDIGEVAGGARTADDEALHAFFWRNGVMTDLGTIKDDTCSVAQSMNSKGLVVGTSGNCDGVFETHGFLSLQGGPMIDLNDFVPPGSDLVITDGENINDGGEIAGTGMLPNGDFHVILLIPCGHNQSGTDDCRDSAQNGNRTPTRPASLATLSATRAMRTPSEWAAGIRARFARRYHIFSPGVSRRK